MKLECVKSRTKIDTYLRFKKGHHVHFTSFHEKVGKSYWSEILIFWVGYFRYYDRRKNGLQGAVSSWANVLIILLEIPSGPADFFFLVFWKWIWSWNLLFIWLMMIIIIIIINYWFINFCITFSHSVETSYFSNLREKNH